MSHSWEASCLAHQSMLNTKMIAHSCSACGMVSSGVATRTPHLKAAFGRAILYSGLEHKTSMYDLLCITMIVPDYDTKEQKYQISARGRHIAANEAVK